MAPMSPRVTHFTLGLSDDRPVQNVVNNVTFQYRSCKSYTNIERRSAFLQNRIKRLGLSIPLDVII